ncbi:MAG: cupredoxin domain-containing protein [Halopseudomonas sp.]
MAVSAVVFAAPVAAPAFADATLIEKGKTVFDTVAGLGCKGCHGDYGEGDLGVGPFIRGATEGSIRAAIEGIGAMVVVKSSISEDDIKAVSVYVSGLGSRQVVRTMAKRGRFLPADLSVYPGTEVQLVVQNTSTKAHTFMSDNMGTPAISLAGRKTGSLSWQVPEQEGAYTLYCSDCKRKGQFFTIKVSKDAKPFLAVKPPSKGIDDSSNM